MAAAYLVHAKGFSVNAAIQDVTEKRSIADIASYEAALARYFVEGKGKGKKGPEASKGVGKGGSKPSLSESEAVHAACQFDDEAALRQFFERPVPPGPLNPNICARRGAAPLHTAAVNGSIRAVRLLLAARASVDAVNSFKETALHVTVAAGHAPVVSELIVAKAALEAKDAWSRTALCVARETGSTAVAELLLTAGAIDAGTSAGVAAAAPDDATRAQQRQLADEFMAHVGERPEKRAVPEPNVRHIFVAQPAGAGCPAASAVSSGGRPLSKLVEYPCDPVAVARLLEDPTVDAAGRDAFGLSALHKFAAWNQVDLLQLLLPRLDEAAVNVSGGDDGFSALHHAVSMGAARSLETLLADGRLDQRKLLDKKGRTAQQLAEATPGAESLVSQFAAVA